MECHSAEHENEHEHKLCTFRELEDQERFPTQCSSTGTTALKTRREIVIGDLLLSPTGLPQRVIGKRELGPDLFRIETQMGSFLCPARQRLHLKAQDWPKRTFDDRTNSVVISWIRGNLLRKACVPLCRMPYANALWDMVKYSTEAVCMPLEMFNIIPDDKKSQLRLLKTNDNLRVEDVQFTYEFAGYGRHCGIQVAGDGLFVSEFGLIFVE